MRVAEDEFVAEPVADIGDVEFSGLGAHLGVEDDVQQHVPQLFADLVHVMARDSGG